MRLGLPSEARAGREELHGKPALLPMNLWIRRVEFHEAVTSKVWDSRSSSLRKSGAQSAIKIRGILSPRGGSPAFRFSANRHPSATRWQSNDSPSPLGRRLGWRNGAKGIEAHKN